MGLSLPNLIMIYHFMLTASDYIFVLNQNGPKDVDRKFNFLLQGVYVYPSLGLGG